MQVGDSIFETVPTDSGWKFAEVIEDIDDETALLDKPGEIEKV